MECGDKNIVKDIAAVGTENNFWIHNVCFYANVEKNAMGAILNQDFQYFILDLGSDSQKGKEEFLRCSGKIVVGSLNPWKRQTYYHFIETTSIWEINGQCMYLSLFGNKRENKKCRCTYGINMESIPFILDPFQVEPQHFSFLHALV
ncbi:hypothetical protein LQZ18_14855 [Lachnospiraceae bacterium ZAX-1]